MQILSFFEIGPKPAWILALFQNTITVRTKSSGDSPAFRKPQRQFNHYTTTFQSRCEHNQPPRNHEPPPTILRVESMNDFDSTIPHSRSSNSDSTMHKQKTARQIRTTALRLAYGSGDMRLFQRTAQKQSFRGPKRILAV